MPIELRAALNALSDVVDNRPWPLREFDQIYMKVGDLFLHAEMLSRRLAGQDVIFVGDGDAVGLAVVHLFASGVLDQGPRKVVVLDFDERMVNSILEFADAWEYSERIDARLYNVRDPLPDDLVEKFDAFHINPPWGQYNNGESVLAFLERGVMAVRPGGTGVVVVAHDPSRPWADRVLRRTQEHVVRQGWIVEEMLPRFHAYHLDDAPDLRSCSLLLRRTAAASQPKNSPMDEGRAKDFYGRERALAVRYVRDRGAIGRGKAPTGSYELELY